MQLVDIFNEINFNFNIVIFNKSIKFIKLTIFKS